uniref:Uncharacterized protein n=1 Tax=Cucumis melo TaxID=3656 RepID=A0A9I9ED94_CUCME
MRSSLEKPFVYTRISHLLGSRKTLASSCTAIISKSSVVRCFSLFPPPSGQGAEATFQYGNAKDQWGKRLFLGSIAFYSN